MTHKTAQDVVAASGTHLLYIGADWCNYCQFTKPAVQEIASEGAPGVESVTVVDADEDTDSMLLMMPKTLPLVALFRDGTEIARRGSGKKDELQDWIAQTLAA